MRVSVTKYVALALLAALLASCGAATSSSNSVQPLPSDSGSKSVTGLPIASGSGNSGPWSTGQSGSGNTGGYYFGTECFNAMLDWTDALFDRRSFGLLRRALGAEGPVYQAIIKAAEYGWSHNTNSSLVAASHQEDMIASYCYYLHEPRLPYPPGVSGSTGAASGSSGGSSGATGGSGYSGSGGSGISGGGSGSSGSSGATGGSG